MKKQHRKNPARVNPGAAGVKHEPGRMDPERNLFEKMPFPTEESGPRFMTVPAQVTVMAMDGFSNPLAHLGAASPLMSAGTFERSGLTEDKEKLTTMYRENSIAKRIIDMPCEDMTRAWYTLSSKMVDETDLAQLKDLEAKHSIKQEITNAIRWARLYGGSLAVMVIRGQEEMMGSPLDPLFLIPGSFKGLYVADLTQGITPSLELEEDLDDPDYGLPKYYDIEMGDSRGQTVRVHHSRVLRFTGRELPHSEAVRNNYWGASELEHLHDEILKYNTTSANVTQLVFQSNLITLKMGNIGADMAYGSDRRRQAVEQMIEQQNRLRTSYGVQIMSAEDSMENHPYNFGGLADIMEQQMMDVAGAAEMPATKLFGRSPQGMNATGEADIRNYYDEIDQQRERILRPALEKLLPVMAKCCWGFVPEDMRISFEPAMTIGPAESSRISKEEAEQIVALVQNGIISRDEARIELIENGRKTGRWGHLA